MDIALDRSLAVVAAFASIDVYHPEDQQEAGNCCHGRLVIKIHISFKIPYAAFFPEPVNT